MLDKHESTQHFNTLGSSSITPKIQRPLKSQQLWSKEWMPTCWDGGVLSLISCTMISPRDCLEEVSFDMKAATSFSSSSSISGYKYSKMIKLASATHPKILSHFTVMKQGTHHAAVVLALRVEAVELVDVLRIVIPSNSSTSSSSSGCCGGSLDVGGELLTGLGEALLLLLRERLAEESSAWCRLAAALPSRSSAAPRRSSEAKPGWSSHRATSISREYFTVISRLSAGNLQTVGVWTNAHALIVAMGIPRTPISRGTTILNGVIII